MVNTRVNKLHFCGPKCSICCSALSVWGIIMLGIMGILLYTQSAAFIDDITIEETNGSITEKEITEAFHASAINCWAAAGVYVAVLIVSVVQVLFNFRKS